MTRMEVNYPGFHVSQAKLLGGARSIVTMALFHPSNLARNEIKSGPCDTLPRPACTVAEVCR